MPGIKKLPGETDEAYLERITKIIDGLDYLHVINGQVVARYPEKYRVVPDPVKELTGILSDDYDLDEVKTERLMEKYALAD